MSAFGTKRTSRPAQPMSAFGGKADIDRKCSDVRFLPKADIGDSRVLPCELSPNPISLGANPCCNRQRVGVVLSLGAAMRRRDFIKVIAGSAITGPLVARAQQPAMPVVGFLGTTTPDDFADRVAAFREGLKEVGYVEGKNVVIEYRWPEGDYDRLATLAAD